MKTKYIGNLLGVVSLFIASYANAATISLTPATNNVNLNDTFSLTVGGSGWADGATAGAVVLTWDASVLQASNIALASGLQSDGTGTGGTYEWSALDATIGSGSLDISAYYTDTDLFGNLFPVTGSAFDFLSLDFTVIAAPAVNPSDVLIGASGVGGPWQDGNGLDVTPDYVGATVTVNAVPVPAAAWLFGSGLIGLVGVARRRTNKPQLA